ncbi:MAG: YidC/Oxa1 family insertase periplasmic-domain containing protein [Candidatus Brocadiaceae bacterium]|jgi:YidC/Oxa1 family membrane protein insertase
MDKENFVKFALISAVILIGWWALYYFVLRPEPARPGRQVARPAEVVREAEPAEAEAVAEPEAPARPEVVQEEPAPPQPEQRAVEPAEDLVLAGPHLRTEWTNVGAALQKLQILDEHYRAPYKVGEERPPLTLLKDFQKEVYSDTLRSVTLAGEQDGESWQVELPTHRLLYDVVERSPERLVFEAPLRGPGGRRLLVRKTVTVSPGYHYGVKLEFQNASAEPLEIACELRGPAGIEREMLESRYVGTRVGVEKSPGDFDIASRSAGKLQPQDEEPNESSGIRWAGAVNHYFAAVTLLGDSDWVDRVASIALTEEDIVHARGRWDTPTLRRMKDRRGHADTPTVIIHMSVPQPLEPGEVAVQSYRMVAAPKKEGILEVYDADLPDLVELGLVPPLSRLALGLLNLLHAMIPNYGVAIILLTAFVRFLLHPLTRKSQLSMAKMQKLQPQIAELQKQHANDKEKLAQAQMELWRKYGVSPLSGCGPLLLQMPVLFALFGALRAAIELRHAGFLWIADLSRPDTLFHLPFSLPFLGDAFNLLPILMAVVMMLNQKFMSTPAATEQAQQQQKIMKWFPLLFVLILYSFPSGLCLYLTCSTGIGLLERWLIERKAEGIELEPVAEKKRKKRRDRRKQQGKAKKMSWLDRLQKVIEEKAERDRRKRQQE